MMSDFEKFILESMERGTPAGGVRSEAFYYDDHGNPADKHEATVVDIHEYDENGRLIRSTIGHLERKKARQQ